ncbi:ankyrin repeat and sam domain-containing protein 1a [Biomphalaria glabrata]|uniref:SAM domain-containing protein n=1 Tax=Biomphalaria glabrata TaxID=6526 RepID=A0A2C9LMA5_BIOGL|nr:hypothetical protein BgiMline_006368 [Biomphalaria glabrata]KAI8791236.1 hypothetical protein BgiBS90_009160 [Biomphalaria glabrata]
MTEESEDITQFLSHIGMSKYKDIFIAKGFDLIFDIPYLTSHDLEKELMITSAQDKLLILRCATQYRQRPEQAVYDWLRSNYLERYHIDFQRSELTNLKKIASLSLPDENLYDELEIVLPGHRRRLERAVQKLKLDQKKPLIPEVPVVIGRWSKPACLLEAKFDFLCVKAFISSHSQPDKKVSIDFMVDSGSDVSTIQEDYMANLNLQLLGPIYSCGIHGGNHTNLYKARLKLGDQELDIEVMASNYNSLGSRVVRHFRHVIDGNHHVWLKGNYREPLPIIGAQSSSIPFSLPGPSMSKAPEPELSNLSLTKRKRQDSGEDSDSESHKVKKPSQIDIDTSEPSKHLNAMKTLINSSANHLNPERNEPVISVELRTGHFDSSAPSLKSDLFQEPIEIQSSSSAQQVVLQDIGTDKSMLSRNVNTNSYKDTDDDIDHMDVPTANSFLPPLTEFSNIETPMLIWEERWPRNSLLGQESKLAQLNNSEEVVHVHQGKSWLVEGESINNFAEEASIDIDVDSHVTRDVVLQNNFLQAQDSITFISLTELNMYDHDELNFPQEPS